jgi:pilus assembly protein Flp/PilA
MLFTNAAERSLAIMLKFIRKLWKNESGATAIEYGLIAALIAVAIIGGAQALGGSLNDMFNAVSEKVDTAKDGGGS